MVIRTYILKLIYLFLITISISTACSFAQQNPILFITQVPIPADFATINAVFGNQRASIDQSGRGGDLWIRYSDGTLKNLTQAAGYGNIGFQGGTSIQVRDPSVHWDGAKAIFSMVVGAPTQQYQLTNPRWQLYEISGLGPNQTPTITLIANQPGNYNNIMPTYGSDDTIMFVSDQPLANKTHTYPQRDEYESTATNTGIWKLNPSTGALRHLDHAPSGAFGPIVDSFGRIIFSRWDHAQRDQQNLYPANSYNAFNYVSEDSTTPTLVRDEVFPENRDSDEPGYNPLINLHSFNNFFPWMMNQDGTEAETLNHIGRQELGIYSERSFNNDSNLQEFYQQYTTGQNSKHLNIFIQPREDPLVAGRYLGTQCPEFGTHAAGQIVAINGAPGINPDNMLVEYLTHSDTASASNSPSSNHIGLSRDPMRTSDGILIASHTTETRADTNTGSTAAPGSRYSFRIKSFVQGSTYYAPASNLTNGITKAVSYWNPDVLVSYNGPLWEMQPVEVVARTRPAATSVPQLQGPEQAVLDSLGIAITDLRQYLESNNLALVVSRNLTSRDRNDRQQPFNLKVAGGGVESIKTSGKIYEISDIQFFSGQLIRGYGSQSSPSAGRRVLAQPLSLSEGNLSNSGAPQGSVRIASDGSMAAFVPAQRALTWQLVDPEGTPVVRERFWLTFQPGEVRVCASCHGVNTADQVGRAAPVNQPQALVDLLSTWSGQAAPSPSPANTQGAISLKVLGVGKKNILASGQRFKVRVRGDGAAMLLKLKINGRTCGQNIDLNLALRQSDDLIGIPPQHSRALRLQYMLVRGGAKLKSANAAFKAKGRKLLSLSKLCKKLMNLRS